MRWMCDYQVLPGLFEQIKEEQFTEGATKSTVLNICPEIRYDEDKSLSDSREDNDSDDTPIAATDPWELSFDEIITMLQAVGKDGGMTLGRVEHKGQFVDIDVFGKAVVLTVNA